MKKIKKRGAVYGVIALMLCVAVYLNWSHVGAPDDLLVAEQAGGAAQTGEPSADGAGAEAGAPAADDYFATSRLSREQARDEAISILKETTESEAADTQAKEQASAQISVLAENSVTEARVESLIRAKGYTDAVVMIGSDSCNVVVEPPEGGLQATDVTVLKDIVMTETAMTAGQIKIVEAA